MADTEKPVEEQIVEEVKPDGTTTKTITKKFKSAGSEFVYTLGSCLAIVISYVKWNSIGWAILHGILGWIYVIYYIIRY